MLPPAAAAAAAAGRPPSSVVERYLNEPSQVRLAVGVAAGQAAEGRARLETDCAGGAGRHCDVGWLPVVHCVWLLTMGMPVSYYVA